MSYWDQSVFMFTSFCFSAFAIKLLMSEEVSDDKTQPSSKSEDGEVTADVRESDREISQQPHAIATYVTETGGSCISKLVYWFSMV